MKWGVHWFRRDLRIAGNPALRENWERTQGRTLGLFCFDSQFLSRADFSHHRFAFFLKTLEALRTELREQGGDLLVVDSLPQEFFPRFLSFCDQKAIPRPALITWNRDYEPFARARDRKVEELLKSQGLSTFQARDHLLFEPWEVQKSEKAGDYYQVYTPFSRKWFSLLDSEEGQRRVREQSRSQAYFNRRDRRTDLFRLRWNDLEGFDQFPYSDRFEDFSRENSRHVTVPIPEAGFDAAYRALQEFASRLANYKRDRDFPAVAGTSRLSIYLKNGSLTASQVIHELDLHGVSGVKADGPTQFAKELAWREFYYAILYHRPDVEKGSFLPQYKDLQWENDRALFGLWQEGRTGFPIVDAGMRELLATGWMHNRVRMIVASFLTKDLLIDWRWGENHFMRLLLDGDLAPNNGGWQWAASTGCDPQPYFRIFNPWLQGKKFDPYGDYIRKYVPELSTAPAAILHDEAADRSRYGYPKPIVAHSERRLRALQLFQKS